MKYNLLIAHPDDEVIFGFSVLKHAKRIICCSSDANNSDRTWCKDRKKGLFEIASLVGAEVYCFDYPSGFYKTNSRNGDLGKLVDNIRNKVIENFPQDEAIFTHNNWGEYGHLDHILVNQIAKTLGRSLIATDIRIDAGWFDISKNKVESIVTVFNDLDFYMQCKGIYEKYHSWTWSQEPITNCGLINI